MLEQLRRNFSYNTWASRQLLASLRACGEVPKNTLRVLSHMVAAEYLWYDRIRGEPSRIAVWPELSLAECARTVDELACHWTEALQISPEGLTRRVTYTTSKGEQFTSTVEEILTHIILHAAYHRGQIALQLREAGVAPPLTDYIHCIRNGLLPE